MTNNRTHLLIIDPQNDFCDLPEGYCPTQPGTFGPYSPSLPVAGAHADMQRIAALIDQCGDTLIEITVTLDSHQRIDIAHPGFWQRGDGSEVSPFTQIRAIDVQQKLYLPRYRESSRIWKRLKRTHATSIWCGRYTAKSAPGDTMSMTTCAAPTTAGKKHTSAWSIR